MSVRSALHSSLQTSLRVLAILSALVLLVVVVVGAIFALAQRNRGLGFSYFAFSDAKPKVTDGHPVEKDRSRPERLRI
jgi:hypothetical protein